MTGRLPDWCAGEPIVDSLTDWDGWLDAHDDLVTASDVAKAMHTPWVTGKARHTGAQRYDALLDMKRSGEKLEQNERMFWGQVLEGTILENILAAPGSILSDRDIHDVERCGWLIRDPLCHELAATPDFFCVLDGIPTVGDLKVSSYRWKPSKDKPSPDRYIPRDYQIQIQVQMACTGAQQGLLVQWGEGVIANAVAYERDEETIQEARMAASLFMAEVRGGF